MSSTDVDIYAELIAEHQALTVSGYCSIAAGVLFLYEYLITFTEEVALFWRRKRSGATALFCLNRYYFLFVCVFQLATDGPIPVKSCAPLVSVGYAISVFVYLPWAIFSALRALALSKNWMAAVSVFVLSVATVGINMAGGIVVPGDGNACEVVVDVDVRMTTMRYGAHYNTEQTLSSVLLRDGTIYFVVLLVLNALHLALTLLSVRTPLLPMHPIARILTLHPAPQFHDAFQNASYVTAFTENLTAILVSRFLLDLQRANLKALDLHTATDGSFPDGEAQSRFRGGGSLVFNNFVDSLGGSMAPSFRAHDDVLLDEDLGTQAEAPAP
ncbi:hypothetical protein C8Q76DRAFT_690621 [Earliella scabrosa]|nr:hypothetical protein C8Q76DRAFT_690621 [Earliella scabrosa]